VCILLVILTYMSNIFLTKGSYENVQLCYRVSDISVYVYVTAQKKILISCYQRTLTLVLLHCLLFKMTSALLYA